MRRMMIAVVLLGTMFGAAAAAASCTILADGSMIHPKLADSLAAELKAAGVDVAIRSDLAPSAVAPAGGGAAGAADLLVILTDLEPEAGAEVGAAPRVEMVVVDAVRGARVYAARLAADRPTAELAGAFAKGVVETRARIAGGVRQVFAVPFFGSRDLTFAHDDKQRAFAEAVQQALCARDGVGVVEMEHAAEVARELRRRGLAKVERAVPLALDSHYRVTEAAAGDGGEARVDLVIRLTTSAGGPRTIERRGLPLGQAEAYLGGELVKQLMDATGAAGKPLTAEQDFAALSGAAAELARYGSALALPVREAALLVNPEAHELRRQAIGYAGAELRYDQREEMRLYRLAPLYARAVARSMANLEHVEYLIRHKGIDQSGLPAVEFGEETLRPAHPVPAAKLAQVRARQDAFRLETWPLALKLAPSSHVDPRVFAQRFEYGLLSGVFRAPDRSAAPTYGPAGFAWPGMTKADLAFLAKALDVMPAEAEMPDRVIQLLQTVDFTKKPPGTAFSEADYLEFLGALARSKSPACGLYARYGKLVHDANADVLGEREIRAQSKALHADALAAAGPRNLISRALAPLTGYHAPPAVAATRPAHRGAATTQASTAPAATVAGAGVATTQATTAPLATTKPFATTRWVVPADVPAPPVAGALRATRVHLKLRDAKGELAPLEKARPIGPAQQASYAGLKLLAGDGFDLFWNDHHVLLHGEAGVLDSIVLDLAGRIDDVAWDGRNIWVAQKDGTLMALGRTGKVLGEVRAGQGLPPCAAGLRVQVVGPGRVIAVGWFGYPQRTWCAAARVGEAGGVEFKLFHEATLALPTKARFQQREETDATGVGVGADSGSDAAGEATHLAFVPHEFFKTAGEAGRPELLLTRGMMGPMRSARGMYGPLRIDPETLAVSVGADPLLAVREVGTGEHRGLALAGGDYLCATNEALLYVPKGGAGEDGAYRVLATFARPYRLMELVAAPDGVHLPGSPWLRFDPKARKVERLAVEFPPAGEQAYRLQQSGWSAHLGLMVWGSEVHYRYGAEGKAGDVPEAKAGAFDYAGLTRTVLAAPAQPPRPDVFKRRVVQLPAESGRVFYRPPAPRPGVGMKPVPATGPTTMAATTRPATRPPEVVQYEVEAAFGQVVFSGEGAGLRLGSWSFNDPTPGPVSSYHAQRISTPLNSSNGRYASAAGIAELNERFGVTPAQLAALRKAVGAWVRLRPPGARLADAFGAFLTAEEGAEKITAGRAVLKACAEEQAAYNQRMTAWAASVREIFSDRQWAQLEEAEAAGKL